MGEDALKAERVFDRLQNSMGMTPEGRRWMEISIDPFHDLPVRLDGFPDLITSPSVVQNFKSTFNVSRPVSLVGTWDCLIYQHQVDFVTSAKKAHYDNIGILGMPAVGNAAFFGGTCAYAASAGTTMSFDANVPVGAYTGIPADVLTSNIPFRILSKGFEVHNVTNKLNVQGSVVYGRNSNQDPGAIGINAILADLLNTTVLGGATLLDITRPPQSSSNALLLPGSRQTEASEGGYSVATMCSQVNEPKTTGLMGFLVSDLLNPGYVWVPVPQSVGNLWTLGNVCPPSPFNSPFQYYSGLSAETVLTVSCNYVLERFPSFNNVDLITLATPSPCYCPEALEVYARSAQSLPTGVPVRMNPAGEYIGMAADTLAGLFGIPTFGVGQKIGHGVDGFLAGKSPAKREKDNKNKSKGRSVINSPQGNVVQLNPSFQAPKRGKRRANGKYTIARVTTKSGVKQMKIPKLPAIPSKPTVLRIKNG
jgi:hypothetical protein